MVLNDFTSAELRMEFFQHSFGLAVIPIRRQPHRFALSISMPPAQRLSYVAIEPPNRRRSGKRLQQFDFPILPAPNCTGKAISGAINRHYQLLPWTGISVVRGCGVCEMMV